MTQRRKTARVTIEVFLEVDLVAMGGEYGEPDFGYWNAVDYLRSDITAGLKSTPYAEALLDVRVE